MGEEETGMDGHVASRVKNRWASPGKTTSGWMMDLTYPVLKE
jgi:hypothetical protein